MEHEAVGAQIAKDVLAGGSWRLPRASKSPQFRNMPLIIVRIPQLPVKTPQIPSNRDHKALYRGTLGGLGI